MSEPVLEPLNGQMLEEYKPTLKDKIVDALLPYRNPYGWDTPYDEDLVSAATGGSRRLNPNIARVADKAMEFLAGTGWAKAADDTKLGHALANTVRSEGGGDMLAEAVGTMPMALPVVSTVAPILSDGDLPGLLDVADLLPGGGLAKGAIIQGASNLGMAYAPLLLPKRDEREDLDSDSFHNQLMWELYRP